MANHSGRTPTRRTGSRGPSRWWCRLPSATPSRRQLTGRPISSLASRTRPPTNPPRRGTIFPSWPPWVEERTTSWWKFRCTRCEFPRLCVLFIFFHSNLTCRIYFYFFFRLLCFISWYIMSCHVVSYRFGRGSTHPILSKLTGYSARPS